MHPILFSIGNINFYSYGLMAGIAFLAFSGITILLAKKQKLYFFQLFDRLIILFFAGLLGARLLYGFIYYDEFSNWYEIFYLWQGGMISYGGIFAVLFLAYFVFKENRLKWFDIFAVSFLLGVFFWRMGCFLAGDHPQVTSNAFYAINGEFPAILLESILGLIGFVLFYFLYKKIKIKPGLTFFMVLGYYGLVRAFVDNYRIDPMILGFRTGQIVGFILVVVEIIGIIIVGKRSKRSVKQLKFKEKNDKKNLR